MRDTIDPVVLKAVVGGDMTIARELIEDFLPSARTDVAQIQRAVAELRLEEVRATSHKLKGAASLVGARLLIALCIELQGAATGRDSILATRLAVQLDDRLREVETALESFLRQAASE
jgi:HPt (histidine-containing phosphotransfer) domain-containing protein